VDNVSRRIFDNYAEYEALYGEETVVPELDQPRAMSQRQVPRATRERLATVARQLTPAAEAAYAGAISLPIWPGMSDFEVDRVIEAVRAKVR